MALPPLMYALTALNVPNALEAAWYLPFAEPLGLKGNHQTIGLDFNIDLLFQQ